MDNLRLSFDDLVKFYSIRQTEAMVEPPTVFISIDFEAWERNQDMTTEIGISVLNVKDVTNDAQLKLPVSEWTKHIKYAHWRISENLKRVNHRWVEGHPKNFQFGKTNMVKTDNAAILLEKIFLMPERMHCFHSLHEPNIPTTSTRILVAHGLGGYNGGDRKYARNLGYELPSSQEVQAVDTQKAIAIGKSPRLEELLTALNVQYQYLHNAGNDAGYTLQAMLFMAAAEAAVPGSTARALNYGGQCPELLHHIATL